MTISPWRSGHGEDRVHVRRLAVQMNGNDGFGLGRDRRLQKVRVQRIGRGVHVHEYGRGPAEADGFGRGDERVRRGDDLVARPDAEPHQRQPKRRRAAADSDGLLAPAERRELLLETAHERPAGECGAFHHLLQRRRELLANGPVLCSEIKKRYVRHAITPFLFMAGSPAARSTREDCLRRSRLAGRLWSRRCRPRQEHSLRWSLRTGSLRSIRWMRPT